MRSPYGTYLDTFKDIWGRIGDETTQELGALFRYLQGYMGTIVGAPTDITSLYLDTFKDIWGRYIGARACYVPNLDTFKDIWGRCEVCRHSSSVEFRYLQGYMGTMLPIWLILTVSHLDTFKDIWGLWETLKSAFVNVIFRYLQGYMGTGGVRRYLVDLNGI